MKQIQDERYMRRALELASIGRGQAHPNPMVGAVIVHEGRIIGEGYHHRHGEAHAEVMAVRSVREPSLLPHSTLYVSLEPCSHYGKTPPCASLILQCRIPRVVIAMQDPYPEVAGRGIRLLREAGVEVEVGLLEAEAQALNAPFIYQHTMGRPWVTLKWAQSSDGFMDRLRQSSDEAPVLFSAPLQLRQVHRERMQHDAILVGYRTALLDNPSLTNRFFYGRTPIRIVLDPKLSLPANLKLFIDRGADTWIIHNPEVCPPTERSSAHIRYIAVSSSGEEFIASLLSRLSELGIQSLLVEGGGATLQRFIDRGLYDSILIERSPILLGSGVLAPKL